MISQEERRLAILEDALSSAADAGRRNPSERVFTIGSLRREARRVLTAVLPPPPRPQVRPVRFTAVEYLALIGGVDRLLQEANDNPHDHRQTADARAASRALSKVAGTLTPAQWREVDRRLGRMTDPS